MRDVEQLITDGLAVLDKAYYAGAYKCAPLFSGGHDSLVACHLASQHKSFGGIVHHIDTGIGSEYTRRFVDGVCERFGWRLIVHKSKDTYEQQVATHGFPGPGMHGTTYNRLKERCVQKIAKGRGWKMLVNGARAQESQRRMGKVQPVVIGDQTKDGKTINRSRVWTAPCHDWSKAEQMLYMDELGLPVNKIKVAVGLSGECFCGSMASPGEKALIDEHAPDVGTKIDRLAEVAKACGLPCIWGERPPGKIVVAPTGPLCGMCDQRAVASGIVVTTFPISDTLTT